MKGKVSIYTVIDLFYSLPAILARNCSRKKVSFEVRIAKMERWARLAAAANEEL
jgi:hypothetical protein